MRSKIKVEIRAELRDAGGKILKRFPWRRANSLLNNFISCLFVQMAQTTLTIKDQADLDRSCTVNSVNLSVAGLLGEVLVGIVIGTGTGAVTMADNKLGTKISTNIVHAANAITIENPDASTARLVITRVFTNNSGAQIGIKEVGLYAKMAASAFSICVDRTLYSVDVPNGVGVTFTYRITVSM